MNTCECEECRKYADHKEQEERKLREAEPDNSPLDVNVSRQAPVSVTDIDLDTACVLAANTDYAHEAVEYPGSEINWADAGAFFLEGYLYAKQHLERGRVKPANAKLSAWP